MGFEWTGTDDLGYQYLLAVRKMGFSLSRKNAVWDGYRDIKNAGLEGYIMSEYINLAANDTTMTVLLLLHIDRTRCTPSKLVHHNMRRGSTGNIRDFRRSLYSTRMKVRFRVQ